MIEKFSDEHQLFQCYKPTKRRLDTCMETSTTTNKMMKNDEDEKPCVTHAELYDNRVDGVNGSDLPENLN